MQGLGAGPISLYGTPSSAPRVSAAASRAASAIAAFALSEPDAGSDVAAMRTTRDARR